MKVFWFLLTLIGVSICGCKNPAPKSPVPVDEKSPSADTLILSGQKLVIQRGEQGLPETVYHLNGNQSRNGYAVEYKEDGGLLCISHWKEGLRDGSAFVLRGEKIIHQLFDQGNLVYEADYQKQLKTENRLYPALVEEFFFEDKYYAKIRFPLPYVGQLHLQVKGYPAVISPLPDQAFQLVINDALDLTEYNLKITYRPASRDTLLDAEYSFKHVVYGE